MRPHVISTSGTNHPMHWLYLTIAIVPEVIATSALKAADGFTRWVPSLIVIVGYSSAFYFLSLTLRTLPLGIAYAVWSGVGVALIAILGWALPPVPGPGRVGWHRPHRRRGCRAESVSRSAGH